MRTQTTGGMESNTQPPCRLVRLLWYESADKFSAASFFLPCIVRDRTVASAYESSLSSRYSPFYFMDALMWGKDKPKHYKNSIAAQPPTR